MAARLILISLLISFSAVCQINIDDPNITAEELTKALQQGADSTEVLYRRAQAYTRAGNLLSALSDLEQIETNDHDLQLRIARYRILILNSLRRFNDAKQIAEAFLVLNPNDIEIRLVIGTVCMERGELGEAYTQLSKVIESDPDNVLAHIMRAIVHAQMKDMEGSRADIAAVEKSDISKLGQLELDQLSTALNMLQEFKKAKRYADLSMSIAENMQAMTNSGWALCGMQQYQPAINQLTRSINLEKSFIAYLYRGKSYYMLKNYPAAESDLKDCLAMQPDLEEPYVFLGYIYQSQKKMDQACDCWRKAYSISQQEDIGQEIRTFCK